MDKNAVKLAWRIGLVVLVVAVMGPWLRDRAIDPNLDYLAAEAERGAGRFDYAIEKYTALIKSDPQDARYYAARGDSYRRKGDAARADADFAAALQRNPRSFEAYFYRCEARRDSGDIDAAIKDCEEAALSLPDRVEAQSLLGQMLLARGDIAAARTRLEAAVARQGDLFPGQLLLFYQNRPREAAASFAAALKHLLEAHSSPGLNARNEERDAHELGHLVLWLHIARLRAGKDDAPEFAANIKRLSEPVARRRASDHAVESATDDDAVAAALQPWPGPLLSLYLGRLSPAQVRAAADADGTQEVRRRRACAADFYAGVYLLGKGAREDARRLLQAAADSCASSAPEAGFAKAEIARIGT